MQRSDPQILCLPHVCSAGGLGQNTFYVDYRTEDGSANAGSDYHYSEGTLVFKPGDTRKEIKVSSEKNVAVLQVIFG